MKKTLTILMLLTLAICLVAEIQTPAFTGKAIGTNGGTIAGRNAGIPATRTERTVNWAANYNQQFLQDPNYYDYMPGAYSNTPIRLQPGGANGDGLFITYMAKPSSTGNRRVYYSYLNASGNVTHNGLFTTVDTWEGYPGMDVDEWGKMMMAWHVDTNGDDIYEVKMGWDPYFAGIPGIPSDSYFVMNNPTNHNGYDDNQYIWPSVQIGPSPLGETYQRVYILARNSVSHSVISETTGEPSPSENVYIAFADYTQDDVDFGIALTWTYTSIPTLDAWNVDTNEWRRPFYSFIVGKGVNAGKVFYMGNHLGDTADDEMTYDVFVHDDYANPTSAWTLNSFDLAYPVANPTDLNGTAVFVDSETNVPYDDLSFTMTNNGHFTLGFDENGNLHQPSTFCLVNADGSYFYYFHNVKDVVYNVANNTMSLVDVFPKGTGNGHFVNWDLDNDGSVDQYWDDGTNDGIDDGVTPDVEGYGNPKYDTIWPFPYYDQASHDDAMFFHLSHMKITNANDQGAMAMVWHDSKAANDFHVNSLSYWQPYENTNEVNISLSLDNGASWLAPIAFSGVDVAEDFWLDENGNDLGFGAEHAYLSAWDGMTPMFAYPAEELIYLGEDAENNQTYRLFFYFHDDDVWGCSTQQEGQAGPGKIVLTAVDFTVNPTSNEVVSSTPAKQMLSQNFPNPFNPTTTIEYNVPVNGNVSLNVYNVKGQLVRTLVNENQTIGKHTIVWDGQDNNGATATSGIYFYKMTSSNTTETRKMIMVK
jgi:hypothetical protein